VAAGLPLKLALGITKEARKVPSHMEFLIERFKNIDIIHPTAIGITLLGGGNNAGKSSVLQAIQFGVSVARRVTYRVDGEQTKVWVSGYGQRWDIGLHFIWPDLPGSFSMMDNRL
jgi:ABC-type uncharacterized transport system ATPase subunit